MTEPVAPENDTIAEATENVVESAKKAFTPKGIARIVVSSSVKFVVTSTIASLVPVETRVQKAKVFVAGYAISGIVADRAKQYVSEDLDEKVEFYREVLAKVREMQTETDTPNP